VLGEEFNEKLGTGRKGKVCEYVAYHKVAIVRCRKPILTIFLASQELGDNTLITQSGE